MEKGERMHRKQGDNSLNGFVIWKKYPKKRQKEFIDKLTRNSMKGQEAIVEAAWYEVLNYCFVEPNKPYSSEITKPLQTDGMLFVEDISVNLNLITEFKDDVQLDKRRYQKRILAQVIFYLKKIKQHIKDGNKLNLFMPNVILAADADQVFVINARILYPYLNLNIDWDKNPRNAYDFEEPQILFDELDKDNNINPYVYDIKSRDFDLNDVMGLVADLASTENENELTKISVNQANIRGVYDEFLRLVTQNRTHVKSNQELVSLFITSLTQYRNIILKNNTITILNDNNTYQSYTVNGRNWYAFFSRFDTNYTTEEIKNITEVGDVLLEETNRRFSGEYWTPTIWANEAIKELEEVLGKDWKENFYVWDAAAGSKNLTRDYKFKHLYSSTLFKEELDLGKRYNVDNVAFQYDFLNDDIDLSPNSENSKLQKKAPELFEALCNDKPLVFFMNPPYGTAGNTMGKSSKTGISDTKIHQEMLKNKIGQSSENLYCQFFYRCVEIKERFNLSNVIIAFFSNSQYLIGGKYFTGIRKKIFSNFNFEKGFLFNAGEFSDTAASWGISFTILKSKPNDYELPYRLKLSIKELENNGIKEIGIHELEAVPENCSLSNWVKEIDIKDVKNVKNEIPLMTGPFTVSKATPRIYYPENALGYAWFKGNNVEYTRQETGLFSTDFSRERGVAIVPKNFERVMINFAIRKATVHSWINNKDSYRKPKQDFINTDEYNILVYDSVVFGLFNEFSKQVSLKNIEYKNKSYNIKNEFFWLSKNDMYNLANKNTYAEMGFNIENDEERFVYNWLKSHKNWESEEAKGVLNLANRIVTQTFSYRQEADQDYPEFNFMQWDAGWEQIRKLIKNSRDNKLYDNDFKEAYEVLKTKINSAIYKFGFLID